MHKRKLLYFAEPKVETILRRQLLQHGYRIYAKVRLRDALAHDKDERLTDKVFDYLTRAHLDFLVTKDYVGAFAVEFDGLHHLNDPKVRERDALKNSLCKSADLALLRINSTEIFEQDQITILDYMLKRYVAWQQEHEEIFSQIREFAKNIPTDVDPEDYAVDLDPTFHFDLRHPFPIDVLYPLSYIKFMIKKGQVGIDYGVLPLEGLWWADDMSSFGIEYKENWKWTLMIMQPELITKEMVKKATEEVRKKKNPVALPLVRFESFKEGKAAQIMHIGPFSEEGPTVEKVHSFIEDNGSQRVGKHHEIYLSDIRRAAPEKWKTIIRQPMS